MNYNEVETCVIRAKNGSKEDLLKVIEQYKPFILKTAREFNIRGMDMDDLVQIGSAAIMKAVIKYKIGSHSFSGYALTAVKNHIRQAARNASKFSKELSINVPVSGREDDNREISECLESPVNIEEDIIKNETYKELGQALDKLSKEDREMLLMIYGKSITLTAYAENNNINYQQAVRRKRRALDKLSIYLGK
jgi:RNA polymerase sigma factor (sigma-70 family)